MHWYEEDVQAAIAERQGCRYDPKTIFYGSSSIRLWNKLYEDFDGFKPINLGFGGSTLAACVWFFDRIVSPLKNPDKFILYAGDNDLGDGRHPEEVLIFFREFMIKLRQRYPGVIFYYISIKPSISRLQIIQQIVHANKLIEEELNSRSGNEYFIDIYSKMIGKDGKPIATYFENDGLHLNRDGYILWRETILNECLLT
ncbi:GDSL-type esterase/lipase family protein [Segetibacter sp.]|jgi:lysophospholipase L1-like esterase|uniref:GDSL-type esterase/lipase family protein n=1 Tax=Segetibacter sp. TaxID=2231182 RepID=UPI002601F7C9|nr:GDSL-type esterase/lipase family protein [Segetibacter sp.]MCW3082417.1 family lipase [Segetibacter sp.]